jgi:DnaJ-class molecular chaperone
MKRKEPWIPPHNGKVRCKQCRGTGKVIWLEPLLYHPYRASTTHMCNECGGKGYK